MIRLLILIVFLALPLAYIAVCLWPISDGPARADFPRDYFTARENFLTRARNHPQSPSLESYEIAAKGPNGEPLTIDIAWFGSKEPEKVILHISGTHGVEGFAGSAIQQALLKKKELITPEKSAVVFLHALNPYGMAYLRRVNESNVDLNRNFVLDEAQFSGAPESYKKIESFLNPEGVPSRITLFIPKTVLSIIQYGFTTLKQAIAGGQYEYPKGIYYGGSKMEESLVFFKEWVTQNLAEVKELYVVEVHTGLSEYGKDVLFWALGEDHPKTIALEKALNEDLASDAPEEGAGFRTPGDLQNGVPPLLPDTDVHWILEEFGTYGPVRMLWTLRDENAYHNYGKGRPTHWSKINLQNAFAPHNKEWEQMIITRGVEFYSKVENLLSKK